GARGYRPAEQGAQGHRLRRLRPVPWAEDTALPRARYGARLRPRTTLRGPAPAPRDGRGQAALRRFLRRRAAFDIELRGPGGATGALLSQGRRDLRHLS